VADGFAKPTESTSCARGERKRHRLQAIDARRRQDADRDAYLQAHLAPEEKVLARGTHAVVAERRILFVWRLHWPPHQGEWTQDSVSFEEVISWTIGRTHDQRPLLKLEHPAHVRIEWVPARQVLWFAWGNASAGVTHRDTMLAFRRRRDPVFAAIRERLAEANAPNGEPFVLLRNTRPGPVMLW
jgi:hypothetical protein